MKTLVLTLSCILTLGFLARGQDLELYKTCGTRQLSIDAAGAPNRSPPRYGGSIWNNFADKGWFSSMTAHYIWLDWGKLIDQGNGLPDEVVDGFRFAYATDDSGVAGLAFNMYYFDSCTGWGDYSMVMEGAFYFTGLPNARYLPPGYWTWEITVDLEGSGREFLMGYEIGVGQQLATEQVVAGPCLTYCPNKNGNGPTYTEDCFDIFDPNFNCVGSYWFGGYPANPYCSFRNELFGGQDPAVNLSYGGIDEKGNDASLYCIGTWTPGDTVRFLLRKNEMTEKGSIVASTSVYWPFLYSSTYNVTLGPTMPFLAVLPMKPDPVGDFDAYTLWVTHDMTPLTIYMQGAITEVFAGGPLAPIDLSNGIY